MDIILQDGKISVVPKYLYKVQVTVTSKIFFILTEIKGVYEISTFAHE